MNDIILIILAVLYVAGLAFATVEHIHTKCDDDRLEADRDARYWDHKYENVYQNFTK